MKSKHTPGPWGQDSRWPRAVVAQCGAPGALSLVVVAQCVSPNDASVIEAAPELLEALQRLAIAGWKVGPVDREYAEAAIAKASGPQCTCYPVAVPGGVMHHRDCRVRKST